MKILSHLIAWLILIPAAMAQEDAPSLITRYIQSENAVAYNPTNNTPEELIKADAFNAELTLKRLLVASNDEELKTCYALRIANQGIQRIESMMQSKVPVSSMDLPFTLQRSITHREVLVNYLREIQKRKAEQWGPGYPPQGVGSPDP